MGEYESFFPEKAEFSREAENLFASFLPSGTKKDDVLLIGLLILFLTDSACEDYSVVLLLAFLLLSDRLGGDLV